MAKNNKTVKRGVYLYLDGKEIKNDINSIDLEIKRLQRDIKDMTRGSEEYNRTMAKIQNLQGILKQHRQEIKGITTETKKATISVGSMVDWFNRFGGVILSVIGFLTGFTLALRAIRDERNKLEESQAGLKALTGLDDDNIAWLTEQAKTLSTTMTKEGLRVRQSAAEILDAFMLVGSAKPELLGDKEALKQVTEEAMRLQAAAKDITLNEAVDSLTLSLNQYGEAADQAGRFSNVLAAGSQAGSANIASQAKAIRNAGTAAASANVPIEQTVALIETLAYRGIKDEVAGTGLKKFFLVLQTGVDEINPKIVGLDKALENLKNKNMDAGAIKKMFGEEGYNTASVILQNTEMVKDFTAAVTGTNVAYEQAAINSDTAQAKLEQARNKMKLAAIDLGEKLNPALAVSTNMLSNVIKILPGLIDWFQKWGTTIIALLIPIATYIGYLKLINVYHTTVNALMAAARIISLKLSIAKAQEAGWHVKAAAATRLYNMEMTKHNVLATVGGKAAIVLKGALYLLQAVFYTLTGQLAKARGAMVAFNMVTNLNPYVAVTAAIISMGTALLLLYKRASQYVTVQKGMNQLQKEAVKSTADQRKELDALWIVAQNNNNAMTARKEAMEKINKIAPDYLGDITLETINTQKAADAKARYIEQLQKEAMLKGASSHIEEESKKLVEYQASLDKALAGQKKAREGATYAQTGFTAYDASVEQLKSDIARTKEALKSYTTIYEQLNNELAVSTKEPRTIETVTKELNNVKAVLDKLKAMNTEYFSPGELISYNAQLKKASATVVQLSEELKRLEDAENSKGGGSNGNDESEKERKERIQKELEDVETESLEAQKKLKEQYLANDKMTQAEYLQFLSDLEMKSLNKKLEIAGLEPKKREEISNQILDLQLKLKEQCIKEDLDEKKQFLSNQQKALDAELAEENQRYKLGYISREEYLMKILELLKKYKKDIQKITEDATGEEEKAVESFLEYVMKKLQKAFEETEEEEKTWQERVKEGWNDITKWTDISSEQQTSTLGLLLLDIFSFRDESIDAFEDVEEKMEATFMLMSSIAQDFGVALGKTLAGEEEAMGEFLQNLVVMVLDTVQKLLIAYVSMTTIRNVGEMGIWGLAKAAAEIALITAAFETAKSAIGNFYTGGYTGPGNWDQPQGIVHSNEFVANRFAVANPNLRPIFDVIDVAQRTGNVGNLTAEDIAAVAGSGKSTRTVPAKAPGASATTTTNDPAMVAMLVECTRVLRKLKNRLDDPLVAETYVTGKRGINQAQREYKKLENNKSRNKQ